MKKIIWIVVFLLVLIIHLFAIYSDNRDLQISSKPLLIPVLMVYFLFETRGIISRLKTWIVLALFFSWVGDILLMLESRGEIFFLLGLAAFLITQIFYIVFFHFLRLREFIKGNALLLLLVVIYYAFLIDLISPLPADKKIPVRVYGVVISFMLMLALHMLFSKDKKTAWWLIAGAVLFVTSDSLLAIDKFREAIPNGGVLIMLTYGLAQLFLTEGAVRYMERNAIKK